MLFRPLTITATTPHGVVLSRPWGIALDGLLASVLWHRRKWAARVAGTHLTYCPSQLPEHIELPLACCGDPNHDADWHWMATFADLHPHPTGSADPDVRWRTSRTNRQRLQQLSPAIGKTAVSEYSGRYQNREIPVMAHPATALTWRAVGDPDAIREILTDLPSIGKHRGVGEGLVAYWAITDTPELTPWDAGHTHEHNILGRPASARCLRNRTGITTGPHGTTGIRPPYLHPDNRATAYHPAR